MIILKWATQYWFPTVLAYLVDHPNLASFRIKNAFPAIHIIKSSPVVSEAPNFSSHHIGESLAHFDLPRAIEEIILAARKLKLPQNANLSLTDGNVFVYEGVIIAIHHL